MRHCQIIIFYKYIHGTKFSSIFVLSLDHQVVFIWFKSISGSLGKQSALFLQKKHVYNNAGAEYYFTGHAVGSWSMKSKAKMHQMIIEIKSTNWELFFGVGLKYSHWTVHLVVLSTLDCSGGIFKTFWFPHCKCQSYLFAGYKVVFVTGPNFSVELKIQCFKQLL